jgi:hypothetical protein
MISDNAVQVSLFIEDLNTIVYYYDFVYGYRDGWLC